MARGMKVMIDPALPDHRKIRALARALKIHSMQALGHVVALWCRVMKECPDGVIAGWTRDDIADACKYDGDSRKLVLALRSREIRLIECQEVHDWVEEQGDKLAEREASRKRKARQRDEAKRVGAESMSRRDIADVPRDKCPAVTRGGVTPMSRPPVPSRTTTTTDLSVPSQSVPPAADPGRQDDAGATVDGAAVAVDRDGAPPTEQPTALPTVPPTALTARPEHPDAAPAPGTPRDPLLDQVSIVRGAEILVALAQVDEGVARSLAGQRPVGEILDIAAEARTKRRPGGHARRAIERGWVVPRYDGPEVDELLAKLREDEARARRLVGPVRAAPDHLPGESEDEYLRRIVESRRKEIAK